MAERKRVKGKKPKETMRQRQLRLLRERRAARNKNVRTQKALPPKTTTGGRRYSSGTASSRRAQAAAKQARAAQGTKSSTVRQGQPAGAANRYFGAKRVARSVRRAQLETAARRFAKGAKVLGKGAARLVAGRDDGSGSALMAAMAANDAINAARGSTAKERNKPQKQGPQPKQGPKPKKRNYKTAKEFAESNNPRYKPGNVKRSSGGSDKSKPKPKQRQNVTEKKPAKKAKPKKDNLTAVQRRAYSADSRNKQYDELRKAGKIKEASALAKKIAADAAAKRKKRA